MQVHVQYDLESDSHDFDSDSVKSWEITSL